jgi:hypothetical protein
MGTISLRNTLFVCTLVLASGCERDAPEPMGETTTAAEAVAAAQRNYSETREPCADYTELRKPLFGDVHVHTSYSFDAAANSTGATPTDAHNFAKGEAIPFFPIDASGNPSGSYRIDRPLDFLAVTDHGEFLGERALCRTPGTAKYDTEFCTAYRADERQGMRMLATVATSESPVRIDTLCGDDGALCREHAMGPWSRIIEAAEAAYDRSAACRFTSFVAYEYTGTPGVSNYHRNVIFRNANVPDLPVSYIDAPVDSKLWAGLDQVCTAAIGCDYLTIPHNTNLSNGRMGPYARMDPTPENRRAYAAKRQEREPIMEIFQHKGASECVNGLSAILGEPDELCDVEAVRVMGRVEVISVAAQEDGKLVQHEASITTESCGENTGSNGMLGAGCISETDFHRSALLVGLKEERDNGINPIKLGVVAATDTHTAAPGSVMEDDWRGHVTGEATPEERLQPGLLTSGIDGNPGGLAGVWAVENSRDAIFDAMLRREVFGTSGPRITPRFFAGWDYGEDLCTAPGAIETAYANGVPMGGDLPTAPDGAKPRFFAQAARDPVDDAAPLQQLQLIKGWVDGEGRMHNQVIPIAGSPDGDASVDVTTGKRSGTGHDTLCAVYTDTAFDAAQHAYYYLRAVENPSARWSLHDCLRIAEDERPAVCNDGSYPQVIQEMAWTSPIWYRPAAGL